MYQRLNRTWLLISFALSLLLLLVHLYAIKYFLYWHHRWFDIPMHIVGGAALGAFIFAFGRMRRTYTYFLLILAAAIGWEIFEYLGHISTGQPDYWFDTSKDIVDGVIGSSIAFVIARKTSWH